MDKTKIFITACLGLTLIGCGQSKEEQERLRQLEELAEVDRLEMQNEYEDFVRQYNELQTQITNDSLVAQLENEQRRVRELLAELKQTKKDDAAEILRLKKDWPRCVPSCATT